MSERRRDRAIGGTVSLACHLGILLVGGRMLAQPAEYGIEAGSGGLELHLVAALSPAAETSVAHMTPRQPEPEPDEFSQPDAAAPQRTPDVVGDGSSPIPGPDATTLHSEGGGYTEARPNYLRNPVPPYPVEARREGQEGLVLLVVAVDRAGRPEKISLGKSSGFPLLDDSALTAVRRWKFKPARMGGLPQASIVEIPIRFQLTDIRD
jgi:protein TonB